MTIQNRREQYRVVRRSSARFGEARFAATGIRSPAGTHATVVLMLCWNPLALFAREYGLWVLVLPVLWTGFAAAAEPIDLPYITVRLRRTVGAGREWFGNLELAPQIWGAPLAL